MQTDNRVLDDLARVAAGALGVLQGAKGEAAARLKDRFERLLADLDLVTREEFDAVKAMAAKARAENEAQATRIRALEERLKGAKRERTARATGKSAGKATAKTTAKARAEAAGRRTR